MKLSNSFIIIIIFILAAISCNDEVTQSSNHNMKIIEQAIESYGLDENVVNFSEETIIGLNALDQDELEEFLVEFNSSLKEEAERRDFSEKESIAYEELEPKLKDLYARGKDQEANDLWEKFRSEYKNPSDSNISTAELNALIEAGEFIEVTDEELN